MRQCLWSIGYRIAGIGFYYVFTYIGWIYKHRIEQMEHIARNCPQLSICGLGEVKHHIDWASHVVSLLDPRTRNPHRPARHLALWFHDIAAPADGSVIVTQAHLSEIFSFTQDLTSNDRLLVHCLAGISRSTAVAIGVLIQHGATIEDAYAAVEQTRPVLWPNSYILELIDEHFGLAGDLVDYDRSFKKALQGKLYGLSLVGN